MATLIYVWYKQGIGIRIALDCSTRSDNNYKIETGNPHQVRSILHLIGALFGLFFL